MPSLRKFAFSAVLGALLFQGCASAPPIGEKTAWQTFMRSYSRTNVSEDSIILPLVVAWEDDVSASTAFKGYTKEQPSSPVFYDGALFVSSTDERLYSYDAASGKIIWTFNASFPIEATPTVAGDRVFFGSGDGAMRCLDKATGNSIWSYQTRSEILSSPIVVDGRVIFTSSDDRVHAVDEKTGERLWTFARATFRAVQPRVNGSPAYSDGRVFVFFSDGSLAAISVDRGAELWSKAGVVRDFDSPIKTRRTPLVDNGLVYVIDDKNSVQAFSAVTGEAKGSFDLLKAYDFVLPDARTITILGVDQIISLDRITGSILWKKDLRNRPSSSIFAVKGMVFVLSNHRTSFLNTGYFEKDNGYIEALDMKNGDTLWGEGLKSGISSNGSSGHSRIALLTDSGIIEVFRGR
ncbi:MAG: PQQ-binding-like beta-propeller repeat protein [Deltaproteobacteria bacterium]|nr:PQQ-binding-like beta-propeller repeat protein [Deltaproteobacteria bacterium]